MRSRDAKMRARENYCSLDARSAAQKGAAEWRRDKPSDAWKKTVTELDWQRAIHSAGSARRSIHDDDAEFAIRDDAGHTRIYTNKEKQSDRGEPDTEGALLPCNTVLRPHQTFF